MFPSEQIKYILQFRKFYAHICRNLFMLAECVDQGPANGAGVGSWGHSPCLVIPKNGESTPRGAAIDIISCGWRWKLFVPAQIQFVSIARDACKKLEGFKACKNYHQIRKKIALPQCKCGVIAYVLKGHSFWGKFSSVDCAADLEATPPSVAPQWAAQRV